MRSPQLLMVFAVMLSACASTTSNGQPSCPAEHAVYTLRGQPNAQLRILRTPHALNAYSELAARVDLEGETYWFAFVSSLGYSRDYVGRTMDPFEEARREDAGEDATNPYAEPDYNGSELISFDADYNLIEGVPQAGEPAPSHLVATGIGSAIWYSVPRHELQRSIWDLAACGEAEAAPD